MTLGELRDQISFEARVKDRRTLGGWIDQTIQEEARVITGLKRFDALYTTLTVTYDEGVLPSDLQHLNRNTVQFVDTDGDFHRLTYRSTGPATTSQNTGDIPYYFFLGAGGMTVFPNSGIVTGNVKIDYWKYPISLTTAADTTDIIDIIVPEVKQRCIARILLLTGDAKLLAATLSDARRKQVSTAGQTMLLNQNGQ